MVRRSLLPIFLMFLIGYASAQQNSRTAYAITSGQKGQVQWTEVKLIDLNSGAVLKSIYENSSQPQILNARTGKPIASPAENDAAGINARQPFSTNSAACAFDKKHNRLYYTPMGINQLRYIDLGAKEPRVFYFEGEAFGSVANLQDEGNHVTRMVIGSDGNGYALTNDGKHLLRFTTGKKPVITDLGNLVDDPANGAVSVHNKCSSWGGDMVADAFGKLHLISARQAVFEIDPVERTAKFNGYITGLPANYTTNGAAVDEEGNLVVSSANSTSAYYLVDMVSLKATAIENKDKVFNTSDLANGNFAFQKEANKKASAVSAANFEDRNIVRNAHINVYPNPVTERVFRLYFNGQQQGRYQVQLVDLTGRVIDSRNIVIANKVQVEEISVNDVISKGIYMVKLVDGKKKAQFADKILIQ